MCGFEPRSKEWQFLQSDRVRFIIWDEAPMAHRFLLDTLDRTLRDIRKTNAPFGGLVILLSGMFLFRLTSVQINECPLSHMHRR